MYRKKLLELKHELEFALGPLWIPSWFLRVSPNCPSYLTATLMPLAGAMPLLLATHGNHPRGFP